jgi:hypothetical protein
MRKHQVGASLPSCRCLSALARRTNTAAVFVHKQYDNICNNCALLSLLSVRSRRSLVTCRLCCIAVADRSL